MYKFYLIIFHHHYYTHSIIVNTKPSRVELYVYIYIYIYICAPLKNYVNIHLLLSHYFSPPLLCYPCKLTPLEPLGNTSQTRELHNYIHRCMFVLKPYLLFTILFTFTPPLLCLKTFNLHKCYGNKFYKRDTLSSIIIDYKSTEKANFLILTHPLYSICVQCYAP